MGEQPELIWNHMLRQLQNHFLGKFHLSSRWHQSDTTVKAIYTVVTSKMDLPLPVDNLDVTCGRK